VCIVLLAISLAGCATQPVPILSHYGSTVSYLGAPYPGAPYHEGVDIEGAVGDDVLAVADSVVLIAGLGAGDTARCGIGVLTRLKRVEGESYSDVRKVRYCHLSAVTVTMGDELKRGDRLGLLGDTGNAGPRPHIHYEIRTADGSTEDPLKVTVGCFDPTGNYPTDRVVLTYPVKCTSKR
jgi:murein DD-endopeptidase MepM/ murein hydrolase activator NlpD